MTKRTPKRVAIYGLLATAVLISIFASGLFKKKAEAITTNSSATKSSTTVITQVIQPTRLDRTIVATGTLLANEEIDLKNEIAGRVISLNFAEGRPVGQGALLVKINDADLRATQKKLELQLQLAEHDQTRAKSLVAQKLLSDAEYDAIENKLEMARADLDNIKASIAKTEIRAPFSGIVGLRSVSAGSNIPVATSIAHLSQVDPIKVEFTVPEKYASELHVGTPITFTTAGAEREYSGSVYAIDPKINVDTRSVTVRAMSRNADHSLLPGNFAKIAITLNTVNDALAIPTTSILPIMDGQKVFLYQHGKAVSKKIEIGMRTDSSLQVTSGLAVGDTVITSGILQLHDGSPVTISIK
jgi:membrane fusion protein (multidrug efflux system)